MISYETYKVIHILGIAVTMLALGGAAVLALVSDPRAPGAPTSARKLLAAFHGTGMALVLVAGFGLLARLGLTRGMPGWAWAKVVVWLVVAAALMLPYRRPALARPLLVAAPLLVLLAGWLAIYKPG